jgi:hypothetical protein
MICHYAECRILFIIMLNVIMLSVVMPRVVSPVCELIKVSAVCCKFVVLPPLQFVLQSVAAVAVVVAGGDGVAAVSSPSARASRPRRCFLRLR